MGLINYDPVPFTVYDPAPFKMKEIEQNNLPHSITGYSEATCGGSFPYVPPAGYKIASCEPAGLGTHGGCSYCLMCRVTCVPETPIPDSDPDPTPQPKSSGIPSILLLIGAGALAYGAYRYLKS